MPQCVRRIFDKKQQQNAWFQALTDLCDENSIVLEIGSGSGSEIGTQNAFYPKAKKIVGIDLDPRVLANPNLDVARNISAYEIDVELADYRFDVIYSHMVAEHIDDSRRFLSSQLALLRPGGKILHSTASKYYWTSLINGMVPERVKYRLIEHLGSGRKQQDVFPTDYQLNSKRQINNVCDELSVNYRILREGEAPGHLRRSLFVTLVYAVIHKPVQFRIPSLRPIFIFIIEK